MEEIKNKAHHIAVTGIIRNSEGKYLICKRSSQVEAFKNKWCVPGGKLEKADFANSPKDTSDHWFDVVEKALKREIEEETGLKIKNIGYVCNLAFIKESGFSTLILSMYGEHANGEVKLKKDELTDYKWVTLEEAKNYNLIENIWEQIEKVDIKYR